MNNSSMFTADRNTHLKIVVVSLVCATLVAGIGVAARVTDGTTANGRLEATVIKAARRLPPRPPPIGALSRAFRFTSKSLARLPARFFFVAIGLIRDHRSTRAHCTSRGPGML